MRGISALQTPQRPALASVLFSSGFYDECILALSSAPQTLITSSQLSWQSRMVMFSLNLTTKTAFRLIHHMPHLLLVLNAETALKMRAIPQALEFFEQTESSLNPIARLRLEECKLWIRLTKNNADQSAIFDYCEAIPAWISAALAKELSEPLCTAFELLSEDVYPEIDNYAAYESLKPWLGAAEKCECFLRKQIQRQFSIFLNGQSTMKRKPLRAWRQTNCSQSMNAIKLNWLTILKTATEISCPIICILTSSSQESNRTWGKRVRFS